MTAISSMGRRVHFFVFGMLCVVPRGAPAQEAFPEPSQGMPARERAASDRAIELNWSLLGLYDGSITAVPDLGVDPQAQIGSYAAATATLGYAAGGRRRSFGASGTVTGNYYPAFQNMSEVGGNGDVNVFLALGRGARLSASQAARFQPYYQLDFMTPLNTEPSLATDRDEVALRLNSRGADGRIELSKKLGRRSSVSVSYSHRYTEWSVAPGSFLWNVANGRFTHKLSRNAALRLGYGYGHVADGLAGGPSQFRTNTADAGIDWAPRRLSARRPTISVSAGTSLVNDRSASYNRPLAYAAVVQPLGGAFTARAAYRRGLQFVEGFSGPLYADVAHVQVVARITKRSEVSLATDYSHGQMGPMPIAHRYVAQSGTAGIRFALTRRLSVDAQYVRYDYEFDPEALLPLTVSHRLARQGIRIGVAGSMPLSPKRTSAAPVPPAD
jgi:hypothetical protein